MTRRPLAERAALHLALVAVVCGAVVVAPLLALGVVSGTDGREEGMTNDSNPGGWPDPQRPGVPTNPERNGAHEVKNNIGTLQWVVLWSSEDQEWVDIYDICSPSIAGRSWTYIGPVLTPAEVAAQIAAAVAAERVAIHKAIVDEFWPVVNLLSRGEILNKMEDAINARGVA